MKAIIHAPGDTTVGVFPAIIQVDGLPDPEEYRDEWRALLIECFSEIMDDGGLSINFEDECPTCFQINSHLRDCPEQ